MNRASHSRIRFVNKATCSWPPPASSVKGQSYNSTTTPRIDWLNCNTWWPRFGQLATVLLTHSLGKREGESKEKKEQVVYKTYPMMIDTVGELTAPGIVRWDQGWHFDHWTQITKKWSQWKETGKHSFLDKWRWLDTMRPFSPQNVGFGARIVQTNMMIKVKEYYDCWGRREESWWKVTRLSPLAGSQLKKWMSETVRSFPPPPHFLSPPLASFLFSLSPSFSFNFSLFPLSSLHFMFLFAHSNILCLAERKRKEKNSEKTLRFKKGRKRNPWTYTDSMDGVKNIYSSYIFICICIFYLQIK